MLRSNQLIGFGGRRRSTATWSTDGLLMLWDIGDSGSYPGSGTSITDLSAASVDGTITGTVAYDLSNGGRLYFNGSSNYATTASDPIDETASWTIHMLMSVDDTGIRAFLGTTTAASGGLEFRTTGGNLQIGRMNTAFTTMGAIPTATIVLVTLTKSGNDYVYYVNGSSVGTATVSYPYTATTGHRVFNRGDTAEQGKGYFGLIALYSRAMDATEIADHYALVSSRVD